MVDVQTYCREGLNDPGAALFRNVTVSGPTRSYKGLVNGGGYIYGWRVIFEVNGKNSYGGYTGWQAHSLMATPDGKIHW